MSDQDTEQDTESTLTLVASEAGWPSVQLPAGAYRGRDRKGRNKLDIATIYAEFKQAFADSSLEITVIGHTRSILLEHGVLDVPILMAHGTKGVAVFIYPEGDPMDAGHFSGVKQVLKRDDFEEPVYYAPSPLPPSRPLDPLKHLDIDVFRELENGQAPNGTYAMWWPTDDEPFFSSSKTYSYIAQFYQALNGVESYLLGHTLDTLGIKQAEDIESNRVALSARPWILPLLGPELIPVYFVADETRGIQFYLHSESASREYCERFWHLVLDMGTRLRQQVENAGLPMDEYTAEEAYPLNWWTEAESSVQLRESQGIQLEYFGGLEALLEDGNGEEEPSASDEQAIPQQPQKSNMVTQILYTCIVILIVVWTIVAGLTLFKRDKPTVDQAGKQSVLQADSPTKLSEMTIIDVPDSSPPKAATPVTPTGAEVAAASKQPVQSAPDKATVPEEVTAEAPPLAKGAPIPLKGKAVYVVPLTIPADSIEIASDAPLMLVQEHTQAKIMDIRRRTVQRTIGGNLATLSSNGKLVASSVDGTSSVSVSDIESGQRVQGLRPVVTPLKYLAFTPNGTHVLIWGEQLSTWSVETGQMVATIQPTTPWTTLALTPDSQHLIAIEGTELAIYHLPDLALVKRTQTGLDGMKEAAVSHDGSRLVVLYDGGVGFFATSTWTRSQLIVFDKQGKQGLAVNEDASVVAVSTGTDEFSIWQRDTKRWTSYQHPLPVLDIYLPPGRAALGVRAEKQMLFWEMKGLLTSP